MEFGLQSPTEIWVCLLLQGLGQGLHGFKLQSPTNEDHCRDKMRMHLQGTSRPVMVPDGLRGFCFLLGLAMPLPPSGSP